MHVFLEIELIEIFSLLPSEFNNRRSCEVMLSLGLGKLVLGNEFPVFLTLI